MYINKIDNISQTSFCAKVNPIRVEKKDKKQGSQPLLCDNDKIIKKLASFNPDTKTGTAVVANEHGIFVIKMKNGNLISSTKYAPVSRKVYENEDGNMQIYKTGADLRRVVAQTNIERNNITRRYEDQSEGFLGDLYAKAHRRKDAWQCSQESIRKTYIPGSKEDCYEKITRNPQTGEILDKKIVDFTGKEFQTPQMAQNELNLAFQSYKKTGIFDEDLRVKSFDDLKQNLFDIKVTTKTHGVEAFEGVTLDGFDRQIVCKNGKICSVTEVYQKTATVFSFQEDGKLSAIVSFGGDNGRGYDKALSVRIEDDKVVGLGFSGWNNFFDEKDSIKIY
ncbi:MAG: hypothetical protein IJB79_01060 [Candidatus Gastranaerophilales bacterium]|nr:hypothetical protein [Candidatus Gastranaerophilales bacterium]